MARILLIALAIVLAVAVKESSATKCYTCKYEQSTGKISNCNDEFKDASDITKSSCGTNEVCGKKIVGTDSTKVIQRACVAKANCNVGKVTTNYYCCDKDFCNAATSVRGATFALVASSLVAAALWWR